MQLKTFLISLSSTLALTACVETVVEPATDYYVPYRIPIVDRPTPVQLQDVKWYVVTEENIDAFVTDFEKRNGPLAFVALSVNDYEKLALNVQDLRRYMLQQREVIVYYENSINSLGTLYVRTESNDIVATVWATYDQE